MTTANIIPSSPIHDALVAKALGRFHAELGDENTSFADVQGPEELLAQARSLEAPYKGMSKRPSSIFRLESILSHINDFAAVVALSSGSGPKMTGAVWGSLKVIFLLIYQYSDTLDGVLSMLDELSLALPRFRTYEDTLPITPTLESALVDVYAEMTCFCARAVKFFRTAPHHFLIRIRWSQFHGDFEKTVRRLKDLSNIVDREAELLRFQSTNEKNNELVEALECMRPPDNSSEKAPCYCLPSMSNQEFFGREEILAHLNDDLTRKAGSQTCCVLLHGLGGVGKTQLALKFAHTSRSLFDAIFWIHADGILKVKHSFLEISKRLGLVSNDDRDNEASLAVSKVKSWLRTSGCRWLMILDNVDTEDALEYAWPEDTNGAIIITARDNTVGFGKSTAAHQVKPFDDAAGTRALLSLVGSRSTYDQDEVAARKIVESLGGLPLAINQISGFIVQQRLSLADFIPFYERNSTKVDRRSLGRGDNEQTISTVWEVALDCLPRESSALQNLMVFFDPDRIHESVLLDGAHYVDEESYDFLLDEMKFADAKVPLLKAALVERDAQGSFLSMHRLVQAAVINRLPTNDRLKVFESATEILSNGFPNTWGTVTSHQYASWAQCEVRVPHVRSLLEKGQKYKIHPGNPKALAELAFRMAWYLYERELYDDAERFLNDGVEILGDTDKLTLASASMLRGLILLDTQRLPAALDSFSSSLQIREVHLKPDDALVASSLNAISLAYTEMNILDKAVEFGNKAIDIRLQTQSDRIGNSYSNMASTLLRMGKPNEAEEMLSRCPSLKDFTDETFLQSGNPRFAGDMVLLSRIRRAQGRTDEAVRLASKALTFRKTTHGDRLKTCDSLQLVADLTQASGNTDSAIYFLNQSISVARSLPYAEGFLARGYHKLAKLFTALNDDHQSQACRAAADAARDRISEVDGASRDQRDSDEAFDKLVPWMLW